MSSYTTASDPRKLALLHRIARTTAIVVMVVALAGLYGWIAGIPRLITVFPGLIAMKVNTAISLLCCGASLLVLCWNSKVRLCPPRWRALAFGLALVAFLVGLLTNFESIFIVDLHIDQIFFTDTITKGPAHPPGRMSPLTAATFIYLGSALMLLAARRPPQYVQLFVCSSGFVSLVVLTGTAYGLAALVGILHYTAVAVHTNFCFMLLFAGILCATGEHGMMRLLTDSGTAGRVMRRLLPTAILVPLLVSSIAATLEHFGIFDLEMGISIFSITTIVAFLGLVWRSGIFLLRSENEMRQSDIRLREALTRYTFLADAMPEIVWTTKANGDVDYFNQRWIEYTGLTLEESRNRGWQIVIHPDDVQRCLDRWNESLRTGCSYEIEYRLKNKDGTYRWFVGRGYPMRDERGNIQQWVGNCTDIDDQKRAREDLERRVIERTAEVAGTRERLQAVLDSATQVSIIATTPEGIITVFNRGAEQMLGYTAEEMIGKRTPYVLHAEWEVAARSRELSQEYGRRIDGFDVFVEKTRQGMHEEREWTYVRKDGSRIPVNLIVTTTRDFGGNIVGFLGIASNLTGRKKAENQLRDQALLLDLADESIFLRDINDLVTYWNQGSERLYGWPRDEALGRLSHELLHTEFPQPLAELRAELLEKGSWRGELIHTRRDGSRVTVASSWTLQRDNFGEPASVIEINHDITARKIYERELQDAKIHAEMADRAKSNFLANMSHEIRTPMNGVIGLTTLLLETDLDPEQRTLSETIGASAESLLGVINDVLDFSKIEAGKLTIEQLDFDLRKVIEDALEVTASLAQKKGLELVGGIEPGTPTHLHGDPTRVKQVLTNLIGNAIKFTSTGEVAVKVRVESEIGDSVVIRCEVRDTGLGISPEVQTRLFQPFVQGDASTSRQFGGTGLGLAICKRLAEAMHGQIGVTSASGEGSTFWVTLEFTRQSQPAPDPAAPAVFTNARVLLVDNNATSRDFLQRQLSAWRLRHDSATGPEEALKMLGDAAAKRAPYHAALVDLRMPTLDGLALAQLIYSNSALRNTRIVLLTHIGNPVPSEEIAPPNLAACCMKPVRQSALFDCLVQALTQPLKPAHSPTPPSQLPTKPTTALPAKKERILLAEDNPVNQEVALGNLRKLGYRADVALNGLEVLEALETKQYDVILMDCQMPELDGYETTRQIRQREHGSHRTRIVAMTANAMVGDREKCLEAGMDDYVSKPIHRSELRAALERRTSAPSPPLLENVLRAMVEEDPQELPHLVELFLATAPASVTAMHDALAAKNAPLLSRAAHTLKGSCGSLGATTLREACASLERQAREGRLEGAEDCIATINLELHRFSDALIGYLHAKAPA